MGNSNRESKETGDDNSEGVLKGMVAANSEIDLDGHPTF